MFIQIKTREFEFSYEPLNLLRGGKKKRKRKRKTKLELPEIVSRAFFRSVQLCNYSLSCTCKKLATFGTNAIFHNFLIHLFLEGPQVPVQE